MRLLAAITLGVVVLVVAQALDPIPAGLVATHFSDAGWTSAPVLSRIDPRPNTAALLAAWRGAPPATFSATWNGSVITFRPGLYTFATVSDDGSWVYVDGQLVVDNAGRHEARTATGSIRLERGVHSIFIKYFQDGGTRELDLLWARDGSALSPVPFWALAPRKVSFARLAASVAVRRGLFAAIWAWLVAALAVFAAHSWSRLRTIRPTVETALIIVGAGVLFVVLPHDIAGDGRVRFFALAQLMEWRELSPVAYSMVGPLTSVPLYLLGTVVKTSEWWCARFNTIVFLVGLWIISASMRGAVADSVRTRFILLMLAASLFPTHLEGYFAETFTATLAAAGLLAVDRGHAAAGWSAAIVGVVNTPATIAGLGAAAAAQTWASRQLRHLIPVAIAGIGIALESWIRRGSPFVTGYEWNHGPAGILPYSGRAGFSYPMFFGVLSLLLSFGKGLLFYAPGVLLPIRQPSWQRLWLAFVAGLILVYAKWWAWYGGLFWGPRFLVMASFPASLALASWLDRADRSSAPLRAATLVVLTLSAWAAIDSVVFGLSGVGACREAAFEWACLYVPEFSALWRPFVEWTRPAPARVVVGLYFALVYLWLATPLVAALARDLSAARHRWMGPATAGRWRW